MVPTQASTGCCLRDCEEQGKWVTLSNSTRCDLSRLDRETLVQLQWSEEQAFARLIRRSPRRSAERARRLAQAYDTVTAILGQLRAPNEGVLEMGYDPRYARLVLDLLARRPDAGRAARFYEIGYGCGALLEAVQAAGVEVEGIEVSAGMRRQALARLPESCHGRLELGNFLDQTLPGGAAGYDVIFWNDVLEHLVPDEALDFVRKAYELLSPGGCLVTITPNWHMRPSDVTCDHQPARTEAQGLHLKEYTLREVSSLLREAGFDRIGTPLVVSRRRMYLGGRGLIGLKRLFEPALEYLPFRLARLLCRGLGASCTLAWKAP